MDNQVRIFRKNPIAWWDKNAMRYLRRKYGKVKKPSLFSGLSTLPYVKLRVISATLPLTFLPKLSEPMQELHGRLQVSI
jgi:hypothetical protein